MPVGWCGATDARRRPAPYVPDLERDAFHCWLEKWHFVPLLVLSLLLAIWGALHGGVFLAASLVSWGIFREPPWNSMAPGWSIPPPTPGAAAALEPATIRPTTGGSLYLHLARAGTTTTTPIHAASATASPGTSLISTGSASTRFIASGSRRSCTSPLRSPHNHHSLTVVARMASLDNTRLHIRAATVRERSCMGKRSSPSPIRTCVCRGNRRGL